MSYKLKVLFWDVETAPLLSYVWGQREDYIPPDRLIHDSFMLSWAAKWEDQRKIHSQVLSAQEAKKQDDTRIVRELADLIREADIVVAHNADKFDLPVLNTRLLKDKLDPLGPVKTIDTLKLSRKSFRMASNRLDYLARAVGVDSKMHTSFDLWRRCYQGDEKALKYMMKYNRQDVKVLQNVYTALKPYVKGLPRLVEQEQNVLGCPFCGSEEVQKRGFHRTNASTFQRLHCQECGRWSRSRTSEPNKAASVPL